MYSLQSGTLRQQPHRLSSQNPLQTHSLQTMSLNTGMKSRQTLTGAPSRHKILHLRTDGFPPQRLSLSVQLHCRTINHEQTGRRRVLCFVAFPCPCFFFLFFSFLYAGFVCLFLCSLFGNGTGTGTGKAPFPTLWAGLRVLASLTNLRVYDDMSTNVFRVS